MYYFFLFLKEMEKDYICPYVFTFQSFNSEKYNKPNTFFSFFFLIFQYTYRWCRALNIRKHQLVYINVESFNKCRCGTPGNCTCQFLDVTAACS